MKEVESLSNMLPLAMAIGVVLIVGLSVFLIYNRASSQEKEFGSAADEFERNVMRQIGSSVGHGSPSGRVGSAMPTMPPTLPPSGAPNSALTQPASTSASINGFDELSDFTRKIATRLSAASIFDGIDGPLRSRNPEIVGTILCLRDNKKIAVIESGWKSPDPDLEMVLSLLDGVILAGPGDEPIFVRKLQSFIGDSIRL